MSRRRPQSACQPRQRPAKIYQSARSSRVLASPVVALNAFNAIMAHMAGSKLFRAARRRSTGAEIPPNMPCGYCFSRWATQWDHLMPYAHGGLTEAGNLYPSCRRCNMMLGHKVFGSIEEKRDYARSVLVAAGQWQGGFATRDLPDLQEPVSTDTAPEILQPEVSVELVAPPKNRRIKPPRPCAVCSKPVYGMKYCSHTCQHAYTKSLYAKRKAASAPNPEPQLCLNCMCMWTPVAGRTFCCNRTCKQCERPFWAATLSDRYCDADCSRIAGVK